jgi:hypothetical protein
MKLKFLNVYLFICGLFNDAISSYTTQRPVFNVKARSVHAPTPPQSCIYMLTFCHYMRIHIDKM